MNGRTIFSWLRLLVIPLLVVAMTLGESGHGQAQAIAGPLSVFPQVLRFERISLDQGLSQSTVNAILQDRQGFLWFATQDGLNRYDGNGFKIYKPDPDLPGSLPGQFIHSLAEDRNGDLWVSTDSFGLGKLERASGRFQRVQSVKDDPATLSSNATRHLFVDRRGMLWVGTLNGLNRLDPASNRVTRYQSNSQDPTTLSYNVITAIAEDRAGNLWVGTSQGLNRLDPDSGKVTRYLADPKNANSLGGNTIYVVYMDQAGILWIGAEEGGLTRLDPVTGKITRYWNNPYNSFSLSANTVHAIWEDQQGSLWVGTVGGGLNRMDRERGEFEVYRNDPGDLTSLSANFISTLYEDRSGVLWVGTEGGGVNKLVRQAETFQHVRVSSDAPGGSVQNRDVVWSFYQDQSGRLYVGTNGGGLSRFDPNTRLWRHFQSEPNEPDSLSDDVVIALAPAPDGKLWAATTRKGLNLFDPITGLAQRYRHDPDDPDGISSDFLFTLLTDRSGRLWIGTANQGVDLLDPATGRFTHFKPSAVDPTSLASGTVRGIYEARDGSIWICTDGGGLSMLDPINGKVTRILADPANPNGLSHNSLFSIHEDRRGILWIGTVGGGLNRFDRQTGVFKTYREKDGLPNNVVYGILEDQAGLLWLSTNDGLARFDPIRETFTAYGVQDGLQSREFNNNAYYQTPDGLMFFGGVNGFNVFNPAELGLGNLYQPPVALTALTRAGRPLLPDQPVEAIREITLTWPDNSFEFEFVGLNYIHSERNRYAYRLENFDRDWVQTGLRRFGQYTNLPGGTYTLRLKAANNSGIWNEEGLTIRVTVVPPFWQTGWFAVTVLGLVSVGLFSGYRLRMRSTIARADQLHSLVEERTQDLEQRNREVARRAEQFRVINEVGHQITSILDSQQLITEIVRTIQRAFGYDLVSIWLVEENELVFRASASPTAPRFPAPPEGGQAMPRSHAERGNEVKNPPLPPLRKGGKRRSAPILTPLSKGGQGGILNLDYRTISVAGDTPSRPARDNEPPRLPLSTPSVATRVVSTGVACLIADVSLEPDYLRWPANSRTRSELTLPLKVKSGVIGILNVESNQCSAFDESDRQALQALANQVAIAVENAHLYEQSRQTAVAEERNRLARELHDAVTQTLFSASLIAEALPAAWESDPREGRDLLGELRHLSRGALAEMRTLLMELRPSVLAESNLEDLLRQLTEAVIGREGIRVNLAIEGKANLPGDVRIALYRIGQEALNNVSKHARASQVSMMLRYLGSCDNGSRRCGAMLTVQDNGRGFDPEQVAPNHMGLKIMSERAQAIGATLAVESQIGHGTQVTVLWEEAEEEK